LNNINQLRLNGACIRMMYGYIWVGRIRTRKLPEQHKSLSIYIEYVTCVDVVGIVNHDYYVILLPRRT